MLTKRGPLEKEMANHISILALRTPWTEEPGGLEIPMDRGAWWAIVHGVEKSQTRLSNQHFRQAGEGGGTGFRVGEHVYTRV